MYSSTASGVRSPAPQAGEASQPEQQAITTRPETDSGARGVLLTKEGIICTIWTDPWVSCRFSQQRSCIHYCPVVLTYDRYLHVNFSPSGERLSSSLSLGDCYSHLNGRPAINPFEPRLETGVLVETFEPGKLVTTNPVTPS